MGTVHCKGDLLMVQYVTGPVHVWLGIAFSSEPVPVPDVVKRAPIGDCAHGPIDENKLVAAVVQGLQGCIFHAQRIEYVSNDCPAYEVYEHCARLLGHHAGNNALPPGCV